MKHTVLCYVTNERKTLMLYRNKKENDIHEGKWNGLGGKIEKGESPEDAVLREVKEESNLEIIKPQMRGIITFPAFANDEDYYVYLFTANQFKGEILENCDEGELHWIENDEVASLPMWDGDYLFFEWMKQNKFFSGKIYYKDQKYTDSEVFFY